MGGSNCKPYRIVSINRTQPVNNSLILSQILMSKKYTNIISWY